MIYKVRLIPCRDVTSYLPCPQQYYCEDRQNKTVATKGFNEEFYHDA